MTSLHSYLYVIRMASTKIEIYSAETFEEHGDIPINGLIDAADMISCQHFNCLYVADAKNGVVHRIEVGTNRTSQSYIVVSDVPYGLSLTTMECNVLVTCKQSNRVKQFTTRGELVREIFLDPSVVSPRHAVQLASGQLVVCHGVRSDTTHRVCLLTADGQRVLMSYDGSTMDGDRRSLNWPTHVAVDHRHGYVYVADYNNRRVVILNNDMVQVGEVNMTGREEADREPRSPLRLCLDVKNNRLYVAECGGHIAVCSVHWRFRSDTTD
jgi:DNA-binding beta-propeller fold protein YncE